MKTNIVVPERSGNYLRRDSKKVTLTMDDSVSQNPLWLYSSDISSVISYRASMAAEKAPLFDEKGRKRCPRCTKYKSLKLFYVDNARKHGTSSLCKACFNAYQHERYDYKEERYKQLFKSYGLTREQYDAMYEAQNGLCAVCKQPETSVPGGRRRTKKIIPMLHVDHDHLTGKIRALLCSKCNLALGSVNDDIEHLAKLIAYIKHYKE